MCLIGKNAAISVSNADIDAFRVELGNPMDTKKGIPLNTVAIGKTDIPGLVGIIFKGMSRTVRRTTGTPLLGERFPNRSIKAPYDPKKRGLAQFVEHAEEDVFAQLEDIIIRAKLNPNEVKGTLYLHQSNFNGVCSKCTKGLFEDADGIFKQFTKKYPI